MKTGKKALIAGVAAVAAAAIIAFGVVQSRKGVVKVQAGRVQRASLAAVVTASGEIKPLNYVNISADAFGKVVKLYVKEGARVKRGQMLAQIENVQPQSDVEAGRAALEASKTDYAAAVANLQAAEADLERAKADQEHNRLDWERAQGLYNNQLIAKQDYDTRKAAYDSANAALVSAQTKVLQAKAQAESANKRINQNVAALRHADDVLSKTEYRAPFAGVITNLPVREGETVVIGIQNSPGSTLMTLADNSVITAEVKVDETDIVNVRTGQPAEVTIDALPKKKFKGTVTEIGENAILRTSGLSTAQSTTGSQEARDFKVTVTLENPPEDLRPGLSATAKITTATRNSTLTIPIQALTIRQHGELEPPQDGKSSVEAAPAAQNQSKAKEEIQGVFVIRSKKATFVPVSTGITGTTDIEVMQGLQEGDEIVTGSYKVLRTLRNGASVKIDNSALPQESH
ncbi:MAG: efflux RND transporter periplasmic adaptor subunit [Candidatus Korobacteraceae bacterium]|jgi:HlyD family secretion protein